MNQIMDRKRLRREYLKKKRSKYVDAAISIAIMLPGIVPLVLFLWFSGWWNPESRWGISLLAITLLALASWVAVTLVRRAQTEVQHIPYVPPVTADTLPTEEILVRAADVPPVTQSDVLLRAAQSGQETPKDELLRVTTGGDHASSPSSSIG